ncbi:putative DNA helicase ino80 [Coemansia sp. Benny D115]|nr:putative DNA helicase ino80 [Coemansia sp. Benny D115]
MSYDRTPSNPHSLNTLLSPRGSRTEAEDTAAPEHESPYPHSASYQGPPEGVFPQSAPYQSPPAQSTSAHHQAQPYSRYDRSAYEYSHHESHARHDYARGAAPTDHPHYPYPDAAGTTRYSREPEQAQYDPHHSSRPAPGAQPEYADYRDPAYSRHRPDDYDYSSSAAQRHPHSQQAGPYEYEYDHPQDSRSNYDRGAAYSSRHSQQQRYPYHQGGGTQDSSYYSSQYGYGDSSAAYGQETMRSSEYSHQRHHISPSEPVNGTSSAPYYDNQHQSQSRHDYPPHSSAAYAYDTRDDPQQPYAYSSAEQSGYYYGHLPQQQHQQQGVDAPSSHQGRYYSYNSPVPNTYQGAADVDYRSPTQGSHHTQVFQRGSAYDPADRDYRPDPADPYASERLSAYNDRSAGRPDRAAGIGITSLLADAPEPSQHGNRVSSDRYEGSNSYSNSGRYGRSSRYEHDDYYNGYTREQSAAGYAGYASYSIDDSGHAEPQRMMSISQLVGGAGGGGSDIPTATGDRVPGVDHRASGGSYDYDAGARTEHAAGYTRRTPGLAEMPTESQYAHGVSELSPGASHASGRASWSAQPPTQYVDLTVDNGGPTGHEPRATASSGKGAAKGRGGADDDETDSGDENKPLAVRSRRRSEPQSAEAPAFPSEASVSTSAATASATAGDAAAKPASKRRRQAQPRNNAAAGGGGKRKTSAEEAPSTTRRQPRKGRGAKKPELSREYVYDEDDEGDQEPGLEQSAANLDNGQFSPSMQDDHDVAVPNSNMADHHSAEIYSVDESVQAYIHHVKQRTDKAIARYEEREKRKSQRIHEHVVQRYGPYLRDYFERRGQSGMDNAGGDGQMYYDDEEYGYADVNGEYPVANGRHYTSSRRDAYANGNSNGNGALSGYLDDVDDLHYGIPYSSSSRYQSNVPPMGYFSPTRPSSPSNFENGYTRGESINSASSEPLVYHAEDEVAKVARSGREHSGRSSLWARMVVEQIPRAFRHMQGGIQIRNANMRKVSLLCQREVRRLYNPAPTRASQLNPQQPALVPRPPKELLTRARRSMREMLMFWKRHEKEEREMRKRAEREAAEKLKQEEEAREARRQARKLNFLITQTELYSHFIGSKIGENAGQQQQGGGGGGGDAAVPASGLADGTAFEDIDFDAEDDASLAAHARKSAQDALAQQQAQTREFDISHRQQRDGQPKDANVADALDAMDFLDPETMAGTTEISQPRMLMCQLKEYQLKGLNWLANLYEQGINGILADEMGLGKTVQSISLLAYLAETHNIWGPFMVVAPASTLHNWQQELTRFVPEFKVLPYWGSQKDRKVLRKSLWNPKNLSRKESAFHVLVTSYQLVVSDESHLNRVKWQYMVLDEAQAIKSSSSSRWKTLLGFHCRNRLLLTGTPIQNSMQELWALLHFIMPTLFDSHEEFSEWFSRDIEAHAENRSTLNQHQLQRLHVILKPFMLRRHKRHVQHELGEKIEHLVPCELTQRQKVMYRGLMSKISVPELLARLQSGAAHNGKDEADESLMNLVMQFRKVCSHPELFERAEVESPFVVGSFPTTGSLAREGDDISCSFATRSITSYSMPKILYRESLEVPNVRTTLQSLLCNRLSLWSANSIAKDESQDGLFGLLRLCVSSPSDATRAFSGSLAERLDLLTEERQRSASRNQFDFMCAEADEGPDVVEQSKLTRCGSVLGALSNVFAPENLDVSPNLASLALLTTDEFGYSPMSTVAPAYKPRAISPPADLIISDRSATWENERMLLANPLARRVTCGRDSGLETDWSQPFRSQGLTDIWMPSMDKLIRYSGKMAVLDRLLAKLKQEGHRVLLYFQMTKMIDLFEEYLAYRKYTYLRLDGSSKISERRDMVMDWQTRDDIFIFLLSTRAGGLGINLTAADTVIFFESDWNPTVDSQAMDRAHRMGQTKQVVVYRLITRSTVEERILQRARQKDEIHRIVIAGGDASTAGGASNASAGGNLAAFGDSSGLSSTLEFNSKEIVSLLLGETADDESVSRSESLVMARHAQETSNRIYGRGGWPGKPDIATCDAEFDQVVFLPPPNIVEVSSENPRGKVVGHLDYVIDDALEKQVREKQAREREQQLLLRQKGRGGGRGGAGSRGGVARGGKRGGSNGSGTREKRKARATDDSKTPGGDIVATDTGGNSKAVSRADTPEPNSKRARSSSNVAKLANSNGNVSVVGEQQTTAGSTAAQTPSSAENVATV